MPEHQRFYYAACRSGHQRHPLDVYPDWAYQALAGLVETYGCGYPNGTFRGTVLRPATKRPPC